MILTASPLAILPATDHHPNLLVEVEGDDYSTAAGKVRVRILGTGTRTTVRRSELHGVIPA